MGVVFCCRADGVEESEAVHLRRRVAGMEEKMAGLQAKVAGQDSVIAALEVRTFSV